MNYRISYRADTDIERICERITDNNLDAAERLDEQIHQAIKRLAELPGMGHTRGDVADKRYRFWVVGNYVIAYRVEEKELVVVRVVHGARDFRKLFKPSK